jgi:hypothetical protein
MHLKNLINVPKLLGKMTCARFVSNWNKLTPCGCLRAGTNRVSRVLFHCGTVAAILPAFADVKVSLCIRHLSLRQHFTIVLNQLQARARRAKSLP